MSTDPHHELTMQLRGMLQRGVVMAVDDGGDVQTVDLQTGDDVLRSQVEVHQPYGMFSSPPQSVPGDTQTLVFSVGGDQGHQVALQLWSSGYRFGKCAPGESGIYHWGGSRVHLKNGGAIDLLAFALMSLMAKSMAFTAPDGFTFTGPVTFHSPVTFTDAVTCQHDVTIAGKLTVGSIAVGSITATGTVTGTGGSGKPL